VKDMLHRTFKQLTVQPNRVTGPTQSLRLILVDMLGISQF